MDISITPSKLQGSIHSIVSKSDAHRLLICSALAEEPTKIKMDGVLSRDIEATISCLSSMGVKIENDGRGLYTIQPHMFQIKDGFTLDCGESGSTLRFLLPAAAVYGLCFNMVGHGRLPQRPMSPLINAMRENGCLISSDFLPVHVSGKLRSGVYRLPGNISSQYISGLLFALPVLEGDSRIVLTSALESVGYVNMTIDALNMFGVIVSRTQNGFDITGGQTYKSKKIIDVQGDWSNAAFWLTAGALGGDITVTGLAKSSSQGDKAIADILRSMGATVSQGENCVTVRKNELHAIKLDASDIPDLVPITAAALSAAKGKSIIYNVGRLRLKESDRLKTVTCALNAIGADVKENEDSLEIIGKTGLSGGIADSCNDHRIAMALAAASAVCDNNVIITNAQAVEKSYPEFFTHFRLLGGKCDVVSIRQ